MQVQGLKNVRSLARARSESIALIVIIFSRLDKYVREEHRSIQLLVSLFLLILFLNSLAFKLP